MNIFMTFLPVLFFLVPIIIAVVLLIRFVGRAEKRADERLKMDKVNTEFQQEQMQVINELSQRITRIEKMLKEVE